MAVRLWKEVNGVKTYFFYSDEGLVAEYDASGTELTSYGYKPDSTWTTDPFWLKTGSLYYFYHNDHLGTPQKLTSQNGMVVWAAQYSAFGEATIETETITNNLRFPGQYYDVETGLLYNYHRYYDPKIGRYLQVDPIGFFGGDINLYRYVRGNPTRLTDSLGLVPPAGIPPYHLLLDDLVELDKTVIPYNRNPIVNQLANDLLLEFVRGSVNDLYTFGPSHPWTEEMKNHPWMNNVQDHARRLLVAYCQQKTSTTYGTPTFILDELSRLDYTLMAP